MNVVQLIRQLDLQPHPELFTLVGCTVAPGFDFSDFELARREKIIDLYPQQRDLIIALTRTP